MTTSREHLPLDDDWMRCPDPGDKGIGDAWFRQAPVSSGDGISLPLDAPEASRPPIWIVRLVEPAAHWIGRDVCLHIDACRAPIQLWLNGEALGSYPGGQPSIEVNLGLTLQAGPNLLALRVAPATSDGEDAPPENAGAHLIGGASLSCSGGNDIENVFVQPDLRRKRITVQVSARRPGTIQLSIDGTPCALETEPGTCVLDFPDFDPWSPQNPRCYTLSVTWRHENGEEDRVQVPFGMREFTVKDERFHLNGKPIFVRGVHLSVEEDTPVQGWEIRAFLRRQLVHAKASGFNLIRLDRSMLVGGILGMADELGLLAQVELALQNPSARNPVEAQYRDQFEALISSLRNHPSLVMWGVSWYSPDPEETVSPALIARENSWRYLRTLDPSRTILDSVATVRDAPAAACLIRPYRDDAETYDALELRLPPTLTDKAARFLRNCGSPNRVLFVSSLVVAGIPAEEAEQGSPERPHAEDKETEFTQAFSGVFKNFPDYAGATRTLQRDAIRLQLDALRANPRLAGYCYAQLSDTHISPCGGLLDQRGNPKPALAAIREVQHSVRPLIQMPFSNLIAREEAPVSVVFSNEDKIEGKADLSLQVIGPTNQVLWKKKRGIVLPKHGRELWRGSIGASGSMGHHRFAVRLTQPGKVLAQGATDFQVLEAPIQSTVPVYVLDPRNEWGAGLNDLVREDLTSAPVFLVPPLANTIRAYPEAELMQVLAQVKAGAVALFFHPPEDWNDLAYQLDPELAATPFTSGESALPLFHFNRLHPIFEGLPSRGLMRQPYCNVLPNQAFKEKSEEDIFGSVLPPMGQTLLSAAPDRDAGERSGSGILVKRYGSGRVAFTHLRVLDNLATDPLADRLFAHMLNHFARRSVPSGRFEPGNQPAIEWLRGERLGGTRQWKVLGEFANGGGAAGHEAVYPPEKNIDLKAEYQGWYRDIRWRSWYSVAAGNHVVDFGQALTGLNAPYERYSYGTAYAYAEFTSDRREEAELPIRARNAMKVWMNGHLIHENPEQVTGPDDKTFAASGLIKQGRNTLLVKCSKTPGPFRFTIDIASSGRGAAHVSWWKHDYVRTMTS